MSKFIRVTCPTDLQFLRPVIVDELGRIGNLADGGYAMSLSAIKRSDAFLSLGLGENWSFEKAISDIKPTGTIDIYDNTVSFSFFVIKAFKGFVKLCLLQDSKSNFLARLKRLKDYYSFWVKNPRNTHHRVRISNESFEKVLSFHPTRGSIGLKIDIEGSEWEILDLIVQNKSRFEFVLLEIHDFDIHVDQLRSFLNDLSDRFVLAHLHANNFETLGSNGFPRVFEITLLREPNIFTTREYRSELPIVGLDVPNAKNRPDYLIEFK